jgi:hypothetical protein
MGAGGYGEPFGYMGPDQRRSLRAQIALALTLRRRRGRAVAGRTEDLSPDGCRVRTDRPLSIDELLVFELDLDGSRHVDGRAQVMRQQGPSTYALRFVDIDAATKELLAGRISRAG